MARQKSAAEEAGPEKGPEPSVSFRLSRPWSCDRGYFHAGAVVEVPEGIAESLLGEGMGDLA